MSSKSEQSSALRTRSQCSPFSPSSFSSRSGRRRYLSRSFVSSAKKRLSRDRFYALLNRVLLYAFAVFLVLCGIAILGQVLGYMTAAKAASLDELKGDSARPGRRRSQKACDFGVREGLGAFPGRQAK